ncbi:uncharacterized protein LTR77_002353 [Saxophila tyrrhenica]|uniref:Uncharacterized protein n=1 Tax=Saxophila tyrrhenica TaxID=1690608 RepID=A0AAV9PIN5_9PEZI|nr:hypothetical protein LTR77_002353 [Saxophila tyrrhenica]
MTSTSPSTRPIFDPVDTAFDPNEVSARDDVESPSLSSSNALARFEFQPGKSKEGTKVLMVEWEDDPTTQHIRGDWEVSWEGKRTVLPARETADGGEIPVNRLYFFLGPGVAIPATVKLQKGNVIWRTNPLPAIFSPELGYTATQAGKRGVLHTIWAKKRLQVLQQEIENELKENVEGIGLEMAVAEKEWIEQNFGVAARAGSIALSNQPAMASVNLGGSPSSPRSPGGGRLMDKLKGLKVGTTQQDLQSRPPGAGAGQPDTYHNPLSPETSDIAVGAFGSFAAIKGAPPNSSPLASRQPPGAQRKVAAQSPPEAVAAQQRQQAGGMASLDAFAQGDAASGTIGAADDRDDLFALPMSPRSPAETTRSPFTFGTQDTTRYLKGEKAQA